METRFDFTEGVWRGNAVDRLPKHDLFFGSPVNSPFGGLPLGDGDMGTLLWFEKDGLHLHINKCDLFSDAPDGATEDDEIYCSDKEEKLTCLRHGGELTVKFNCPLFDRFFLQDYAARLSLSDATARINAETPFAALHAEAFADAETHVSVLNCTYETTGDSAPEISLFRWGSRTMWRWYAKQEFSPETGLDGTSACAGDGLLLITQTLNTGSFCLGVAVDCGAEKGESERLGDHVCRMCLPKEKKHIFTLYYTIAHGETPAAAKENCRRCLEAAAKKGVRYLQQSHREAWTRFWNQSFVSIPDDYIENIYYLYLYYMNSQSRGAYPPHFTVGLWSFRHDYVPWVYYFHYNMQHMYAPLDAAGHGALMQNYFAMRRAGLSRAYLFSARAKKAGGAFYHDVSDRYGRFADYDSLNCTPGAQIAMQMYRRWRYCGDREFLENTALPVMIGAAEYYLSVMKQGEDGLYHIYGTTAYEGNRPTDDTLTDLVMVRALFSALHPFADRSLRDKLQNVLSALPAPVKVPLSAEDMQGDTFAYGIGKGNRPCGDRTVFAAGLRGGAPVRIMKKEPEYGFPDIELSPLYPAGIFGLKDRGGPYFDTMKNQIAIGGVPEMEWSMYPVYLARMGMAEALVPCMKEMLEKWQRYPNGMGSETGMSPGYGASRWFNVESTQTGTVTKVDPEDYAHYDFETVPIIAKGVQEALLQSHEGVIRLFPAVKADDAVSFSLFAEGGFLITAEASPSGMVATVENLRGEKCFVALPERFGVREVYLYRIRGGKREQISARLAAFGPDMVLELRDGEKGDLTVISTVPETDLVFTPAETTKPNEDMKEYGEACLGAPRLPK